jgi:hypothetical protein
MTKRTIVRCTDCTGAVVWVIDEIGDVNFNAVYDVHKIVFTDVVSHVSIDKIDSAIVSLVGCAVLFNHPYIQQSTHYGFVSKAAVDAIVSSGNVLHSGEQII